jgi:proteasome assembly chaperone (PAC2) family protein
VTELDGVPVLRNPVLIAAFEGWNDAADAASDAVEHLEDVWDAQPFAALDPDDYYDFQVNRPMVNLDEDGVRRITWPTTRVSIARLEHGPRDVVLVRGIEPNMRWRAFCDELVSLGEALKVTTVVTLGALLSDTPHSRPVRVTGNAANEHTATALGVEPSRYEGPTGIVGVFADAAAQAGWPAASFWAHVPHYAAQPPCPKATIALLHRVEDFLDIPIALGDLPEEARAWEHGVDELAREDTEVAEYVRSLEDREPEAELPEASGDAIAREFERYLRHRGEPDS